MKKQKNYLENRSNAHKKANCLGVYVQEITGQFSITFSSR